MLRQRIGSAVRILRSPRHLGAIAAAMLVLPAFSATSQARWRPPQLLAAGSPQVAGQGAGGELVLWAGIGRAARFSWPIVAGGPQRLDLDEFVAAGDGRWAMNRRGDAVLVDASRGRLHALAIDASGTRAEVDEPVPADHRVTTVRAAVGADGTGVVVWTEAVGRAADAQPAVWARLRPPGAAFEPAVMLPGDGAVRGVDVSVRPDGVAEVAHVDWDGTTHHVLHAEVRSGLPPAPPLRVPATIPWAPFLVAIIADGGGPERIVYGAPWSTSVRTGDAAWAAPWPLAGGGMVRDSIATLPDGTTLLGSATEHDVRIARAAPGGPPQEPVTVARVTGDWTASNGPNISVSGRGDVVVAWVEVSSVGLCALPGCFTRVRALRAAPGAPFGPSEVISPLGARPLTLTTGINDRGQALVAWRDESPGIDRAHVMAVLGDDAPALPARVDRRRPRVAATTSRARLRRAARSGRLTMRMRCNEACAIHATVYSAADPSLIYLDLPAVVLPRAGTTTARWRLTADDRYDLRRILRAGRPSIDAVASDRAGNLTCTCARAAAQRGPR